MSNMILLPDGWQRPRGFSHGIKARGETIFTGGIVGWDAQERFVGPDMVSQFEQILRNTVAVLAAGGARPEHIVRMTWYVTDRDEYSANLAAIGAAYRTHIGLHFPAMAVVQVAGLIEPAARIEIETTAVIPDLDAGA
ncbi:RidA family protein [Sphingomonas alpina]|uniref:RidA family protein n=1 Tax=Sphingomonas alpina TaxID=653931 RepID=A0A7H0LG68_9SPHN|nr:RidA family protein [Sphingomonas alpina]QNQ08671.1 RidA family protein [Sphingomonas alpina]